MQENKRVFFSEHSVVCLHNVYNSRAASASIFTTNGSEWPVFVLMCR